MPNRVDSHYVTKLLETWYSYKESWADAIEKTEESINYLLGDQWADADKISLQNKNLPYLTKNLILPIWNRVTGSEKQNRTDSVVIPTEGGLDEIAYAMTRMNYYFANKDFHQNIFSKMFEYGLASEMGAYLRILFSTEDDPLGELKYRFIPGANILRDPMARDYSLDGDRRVLYTTWADKETAMSMFPGKREVIKKLQDYSPSVFGRLLRTTGKKTDFVETDRYTKGSRYRILEQWEMTRSRQRVYYNPYTDEVYRPQNPAEVEEMYFHKPEAIPRDLVRKRMDVTITIGDTLLIYQGKAKVQNGMYPFIGFYPYHIDGDIMGLVHNLKDYQNEHNKRSSQFLHIIGTMANPVWLARKGSVNVEKLEEDGSMLGSVITYTGNEPPTRDRGDVFPQGLLSMDQEAKTGMYETSGVSPNLLGRSETAKETGILFENRVNEGVLMLQNLFDNYRLTKNIAGKYNIWYYQNLFTSPRVFTIINEQNKPERIPINQQVADEIVNDMRIGKYDVRTESVATAASAKMQEDRALYQLSKVTPPELVPWDEVWRRSGMRDSDKIADRIAQKMGVQGEVEQGLLDITRNQPQPEGVQ